MIDVKEFRDLILVPAIKSVDLFSAEAVQLLLSTMAQESSMGKYVAQKVKVGYGAALGVFQMESVTYNDIVNGYIEDHPVMKQKILDSCNFKVFPSSNEMIWNLRFASIMARIFYLRCLGELPAIDDVEGQFKYYKTFWNTSLGKATHEEFMANHKEFLS